MSIPAIHDQAACPAGLLLLSRSDTRQWIGDSTSNCLPTSGRISTPPDELHQRVSVLVEQAVSISEDSALTFTGFASFIRGSRDADPKHRIPEIEPLRIRPPRLTNPVLLR